MTTVLLIISGFLLVLAVVFFFLWKLCKDRIEAQKKTIDKLVAQSNEARETVSQLERTISIMKENRKEADEKINDLHSNGDAVDNALDVLRNKTS